MILVAKMVFDGIIEGIHGHGDTDGVKAEALLEITPLLSLLNLLRRKRSPGSPCIESRCANLMTHNVNNMDPGTKKRRFYVFGLNVKN